MIDVSSLETLPNDLTLFSGAPLSKLVEVVTQLGATFTPDDAQRFGSLIQFRVLQTIRRRTDMHEGMSELSNLLSGESFANLSLKNPRFLGFLEGMFDILDMANHQPDALQVIKTYLPYSWDILKCLYSLGKGKIFAIRLLDRAVGLDLAIRDRVMLCLIALEKVGLVFKDCYANDPELTIVVCQRCETIDNVSLSSDAVICGNCKDRMKLPDRIDEVTLRNTAYVTLDKRGRDLMTRQAHGEFIS